MHRLGLTVQLAKINTHVNQVLDVFYVCGPNGKKILSETLQDELRASILAQVLEPEDEASPPLGAPPLAPVPRVPIPE